MAFFNGMDGDVTWAAGYDTGVKAFEITDEIETAEYLNWDSVDNYVGVLSGAKRWSGTITADFDDATALPTGGTSGAATLRAAAATQTWSGTIVATRVRSAVQKTAAVVEAIIEFVGNGTLTRPDGT